MVVRAPAVLRAAAALLLVAALAYWLSGKLSRPIQALAEVARGAAAGALVARVPETGPLEIREAVLRFNELLEARSEAERAELERLDRDRAKRKLKGGTVCVFVIDPDGSVLATQPVQQAYKPENLVPFLEKIVAVKHLQPRDAESILASAAVPAAIKPQTDGGRLVHIYTRCDQS